LERVRELQPTANNELFFRAFCIFESVQLPLWGKKSFNIQINSCLEPHESILKALLNRVLLFKELQIFENCSK
jgi:hypothetical protein